MKKRMKKKRYQKKVVPKMRPKKKKNLEIKGKSKNCDINKGDPRKKCFRKKIDFGKNQENQKNLNKN